MLKNVSSLKFGDITFDISRQNIPAKNPLPVISEDNIYKHEIESAEDKFREFVKSCEEKNHNVREALIRKCAELLVILQFDGLYIISFQSQLQALTLITSCPPISKNTMLEIYNEAICDQTKISQRYELNRRGRR